MSVTICSPIKVPKAMQATRLDPSDRNGTTVSNAAVLNGSREPISVQREMPDGGMQIVGTSEIIKTAEAASPSFTTTPERVYADSALIQAATDSAIGINPEPRASSVLTLPTPAIPSTPQKPTPGLIQVTPQTPQAQAPKVRVSLSNRSMGKHRITVRSVAISETLVILAYPKDSDNIIEPPICGSDSPIRVDYGGESYHCVFGGWTAELEGMFLVVLIRHDPAQS